MYGKCPQRTQGEIRGEELTSVRKRDMKHDALTTQACAEWQWNGKPDKQPQLETAPHTQNPKGRSERAP